MLASAGKALRTARSLSRIRVYHPRQARVSPAALPRAAADIAPLNRPPCLLVRATSPQGKAPRCSLLLWRRYRAQCHAYRSGSRAPLRLAECRTVPSDRPYIRHTAPQPGELPAFRIPYNVRDLRATGAPLSRAVALPAKRRLRGSPARPLSASSGAKRAIPGSAAALAFSQSAECRALPLHVAAESPHPVPPSIPVVYPLFSAYDMTVFRTPGNMRETAHNVLSASWKGTIAAQFRQSATHIKLGISDYPSHFRMYLFPSLPLRVVLSKEHPQAFIVSRLPESVC